MNHMSHNSAYESIMAGLNEVLAGVKLMRSRRLEIQRACHRKKESEDATCIKSS